MNRLANRIGFGLLIAFAWTCVVIFFVWTTGAIYFLTILPAWLSVLLASAYFSGMLVLLKRTIPRSRWLSYAALSIAVVYLVTLVQRPSNDRVWAADQLRMPIVRVLGERIQISNVRHCRYRTEFDYDVEYEKLAFNRDQLVGVWFIVQRFSSIDGLAHTFLSFELSTKPGPQFFSVSVEIRREANEIFSPIRGLYRQYELIYVIGDERDLIGVRTNIRQQDRVHMYRVNATPEQVRYLFDDVASRVNGLRANPEFYHTFLNNCANAIVSHTYELTLEPLNWLDPRIVMPGFSDRYAASRGLIGNDNQSFSELQALNRIDERARLFGLTDEYSLGIRERN